MDLITKPLTLTLKSWPVWLIGVLLLILFRAFPYLSLVYLLFNIGWLGVKPALMLDISNNQFSFRKFWKYFWKYFIRFLPVVVIILVLTLIIFLVLLSLVLSGTLNPYNADQWFLEFMRNYRIWVPYALFISLWSTYAITFPIFVVLKDKTFFKSIIPVAKVIVKNLKMSALIFIATFISFMVAFFYNYFDTTPVGSISLGFILSSLFYTFVDMFCVSATLLTLKRTTE